MGEQGGDLPGQSVLPAWLGQPGAARSEVVVYDEYGSTRMVRTDDCKYVHRYPDGPHELYDLAQDPDERRNRVDDPDQAGRLAAMRRRLEDWFARYSEPDRDGRQYHVTGKGQLRPVGSRWQDGREAFAQE